MDFGSVPGGEDFVSTLGGLTNSWQVGVVTRDDGCVNHGVLDATTPEAASTFAAATLEGNDSEVAVSGLSLCAGWTWDATTNAVVRDLDVARSLAPNATVTVTYRLLADRGA